MLNVGMSSTSTSTTTSTTTGTLTSRPMQALNTEHEAVLADELVEMSNTIEDLEKKLVVEERNAMIKERDAVMAERDAVIAQRQSVITASDQLASQLMAAFQLVETHQDIARQHTEALRALEQDLEREKQARYSAEKACNVIAERALVIAQRNADIDEFETVLETRDRQAQVAAEVVTI